MVAALGGEIGVMEIDDVPADVKQTLQDFREDTLGTGALRVLPIP